MLSDNQSSNSPWSAQAKALVTSGVGKSRYCFLEDTDCDGARSRIQVTSNSTVQGGTCLTPFLKTQATDKDLLPESIADAIRLRARNETIRPSDVMLASINPTGDVQDLVPSTSWYDVELRFTTDG